MEGDDPHLMTSGTERSDFCEERQRGSSLPDVPVEKRRMQTLPWGVRLKAAKATASTPRFLGIAGIILLALSAGIIVAGIALPNRPQTSSPPSSTNDSANVARDGEGVPLDALQPPDPGSLSECTVKLENWQNYAANAAQAEINAYGIEVTNATPDILISSLQSLPQLQLSIRYLVLYSPSHPWSRSFRDAAAVQTSLLDAAFSGMKLEFRLDAVFGIPATDDQVKTCGTPEEIRSTSMYDSGDGNGKNNEEELKNGSFISQLVQTVNTSNAITVIVCDPGGVNGATNILGGNNDDSSSGSDSSTSSSVVQNILDKAIVLRRGALWQSRTSLVHQIGHYLGLPHPFPDSKSCKYDADTIVDTPQQYQSSTICDVSQPVPLCDQTLVLNVEDYPMYGFMETTISSSTNTDSNNNDSSISGSLSSLDGGGGCRRHFSPGQVLRARAMLRMLRPELYTAGLSGLENMERLPWAGAESNSRVNAWQSGLPSAAVVARQLSVWKTAAAATAAAITASTAALDNPQQSQQNALLFPNNQEAATRLTSALGQAPQAAGGSGGSTSIEECTCLGPDSAENVFWTGKLDASYFVDAVRIVQPWELVVNTTAKATSLPSDSGNDASSSSSSSPSPEWELPSRVGPRSPPTGSSTLPLIEVRVGNSPNYWENKVCGKVDWRGEKLVHLVTCTRSFASSTPTSGQFITVRWLNWQKLNAAPIILGMSSTTAAAAAATPKIPPLCLCDVSALSYTSPPLRPSTVGGTGHVPGALLNGTTGAMTTKTATATTTTTTNTSSSGSSTVTAFSDFTFSSSSLSSCSSSGEEHSWSMSLTSAIAPSTTDPVWVNGVRFSIPNKCSGLTLMKSTAKTSTTPGAGSTSASSGATSSDGENEDGSVPVLWQPPLWNTTALKCAAYDSYSGSSLLSNVSFNIYILPAAGSGAGAGDGKNSYINKTMKEPVGEEYVCARGVEVSPGQVVDIECDRSLQGHVITFFLTSPSGTATTSGGGVGAPVLELCGVQPIGGITLINADIIAAEQQTTVPERFMPLFSLAVDENKQTCLVDTSSLMMTGFGGTAGGTGTGSSSSDSGTPSNNTINTNDTNSSGLITSVPADEATSASLLLSSSFEKFSTLWKTGFKGEYLIVGVEITTKTPANKNSGEAIASNTVMQFALFDSAGQEIVVKNISSTSSSSPAAGSSPSTTITVEEGDTMVYRVAINPPVYARAAQLTGFNSLCEINFIAASRTPTVGSISGSSLGGVISGGVSLEHAVAADHTLPPRIGWTVSLNDSANVAADPSAENTNTAAGENMNAMVDGDPMSCPLIQILPTFGLQVKICLGTDDARYQIPFIQLLGNASGGGGGGSGDTLFIVSVVDSSSNQEFICGVEKEEEKNTQEQPQQEVDNTSTGSTGGSSGGGEKVLKPWQVLGVECPATAIGDTILLKLSSNSEQMVGICEVWAVGLTRAP